MTNLDGGAEPSVRQRYTVMLPIVLLAVIAVFFISTIRAGHSWGDDFALYVLQAQNLAEGKGYAPEPYIHNPLYADIGPRAYPPMLPLTLAPTYKLFGFHLTVMKIAVCAFFLAALWPLYSMYRIELPWPYAVTAMVLLGLNPVFWDFKDEILSDFPFFFFVWATLYGLNRHYAGAKRNAVFQTTVYAVLIGTCMYLAYSSRVIGIVMPVSLVIYELLKFKRLSLFAVIVLVAVSILIAFQGVLLSGIGGGYAALLTEHTAPAMLNAIRLNIVAYLRELPSFWDNGYSKAVTIAMSFVLSLVAVVGLTRRLRKGITITEVFLGCYLLVLILFPFPTFRYLYPIIPIYLLYACLGTIETGTLMGVRRPYVALILLGAVTLSYCFKYTTFDYGPLREGIEREESKELFQHLRTHSHPTDVIIFRKPRALALLTGRPASIYPRPAANSLSADETAWTYFQQVRARYFVLGATAWVRNPVRAEDIEWERHFIETCLDRCKHVFLNADFQVYELTYPLIGNHMVKTDPASMR